LGNVYKLRKYSHQAQLIELKQMRKLGWFILFILFFPFFTTAQNEEARIDELASQLDVLNTQGVDLEQPITISLNGSIQELVTFLGESTGINLSIDPTINKNVSTSFTQAPVKDIILYLCDAHSLDLKFSGTIIQLIPYKIPEERPLAKVLDIEFEEAQKLLTINLKSDTLAKVTKRIAELSGQNIAVSPDVRDLLVSGFVKEASIETALRQIAINNDLEFEADDNFFLLKSTSTVSNNSTPTNNGKAPQLNTQNLSIRKSGANKINVNALNVPVIDFH